MIEKISPKLGKLHAGDIVILNIPEVMGEERSPIIKRVIGVENDVIEIKDGKVYVNDKIQVETYINGDTTLPGDPRYAKIVVPKGQIYVLGDNRFPNQSTDSRIIGPQEVKKVGGKVLTRIFPLNRMGKVGE